MADTRQVVTIATAILLIIAGIYFLFNSMSLITSEPPRVAASLLAAVLGLSLVSAAVTLLRTWLLSEQKERPRSGVR
ncbi:MAG: hypothetical protein F7C82_03075 [Desulfurococcales archaeon]|nr:hypothetical protein [Desulfurococcales archaeon]MCE4622445.1 hypothetical protein [Desulfurococcales archaeon]MCE4627404.1 hypothetical protein [Desulfurococcales archaeon]MCE4629239.1 hypothetical protein [Desulfurococcales archaeon]